MATDELEVTGWLQQRFPRLKIFFLDNAPRLSSADSVATEGGTHKSARFSPELKAESGVLDCLLLASTDYIIKNRSSLSEVALELGTQRFFTFILADDLVYRFEFGQDSLKQHASLPASIS